MLKTESKWTKSESLAMQYGGCLYYGLGFITAWGLSQLARAFGPTAFVVLSGAAILLSFLLCANSLFIRRMLRKAKSQDGNTGL